MFHVPCFMRVLFFNYEYPPLGGGAANATFYLLREFSKMPGLEVDLVTSSVDKDYHLEKAGENINVHRLPIGKNPQTLHYQSQKELLVYSWRAFRFSKKLMKEKKFDLCLAFFGIPCGFIAMILGLPYIVSLRGSDTPFYSARFYWLDKLIFQRLSKLIWKRAAKVVALSHDLVILAQKTSANQKIEVVYNGINTEEFQPDPVVLFQEKTFNILSVGRLIERKGLIYILEALKNLSPKYPLLKLLVAGDGPLKADYLKYAEQNNLQDKVEFMGIVDHGHIAKIFQRSHVFVLASLNEALGNVTQEALASGLPLITTKTGAAELLEENGFIVAKKSAAEIQRALEKLIADEELRKKMSAKSRELALRMSWENTAKKYLEIFREKTK